MVGKIWFLILSFNFNLAKLVRSILTNLIGYLNHAFSSTLVIIKS